MTASENARHQSEHGPQFGYGECLLRTRGCFGAPSIGDFDGDGSADAEDGWKATQHKHAASDFASIPANVPLWWGGGSSDHGHVAVSAGNAMCWSTDIRRTGYFDLVPIAEISQRWGLPFLGWTEDINGVRVWTQEEEDDMVDPKVQEQLDRIEADGKQALQEQRAFRKGQAANAKQARETAASILAESKDDASRAQARRIIALLEADDA